MRTQTIVTSSSFIQTIWKVWVRHSGGRHSGIRSPIRCLPVVIQGHRAAWMTKSMLLNYATDYQKSEALI